MHALKYAKQQELKQTRQQKVVISKESESLAGQYDARRYDWTKAHEEHLRGEEQARTLSAKLEAVEKDKEAHRRRAQQHRDELARCTALHDQLKREVRGDRRTARAPRPTWASLPLLIKPPLCFMFVSQLDVIEASAASV